LNFKSISLFTFNIADAAITVGLVIFILTLFIKEEPRLDPGSPTSLYDLSDGGSGR